MAPHAEDLSSNRSGPRASRPVRIASCSGAQLDPGWQMRKQAVLGEVDFLTGDWLAENNLAQEAEPMKNGTSTGYKKNAWDALELSMDVIAEKRLKVVINGGALNPKAMATRCQELISRHKYALKVAFVSGDNMLENAEAEVAKHGALPPYFHADVHETVDKWRNDGSQPLLAANTYLGARAIVKGLESGADIIICGRVADAAPVVGAAWWWHGWSADDYDELAGALMSGHMIECSAYITGGNFSGFHRFDLDTFVDVGYPIAEVSADGTCVITKHPGTKGMITEDTVRCQLLYEIQGSVYLNNDVKAVLDNVRVEQVGPDRVKLSGVLGRPPPPTTKLALFYKGGYEAQFLINACGYATATKYKLYEKQMRYRIAEAGLTDAFDTLEFQVVGIPRPNPRFLLESTTYCRTYAQASSPKPLLALRKMIQDDSLQHFSGRNKPQDGKDGEPRSFVVYYPSIIEQSKVHEAVHLLDAKGTVVESHTCAPLPRFESIEKRLSYDPVSPIPLEDFGSTVTMPLGNIVLGRSGDKGPNLNCGLFVHNKTVWDWFRSFMTLQKLKELIDLDWRDSYRLERVEFPGIFAVHFVVYGILGRGVSSSTILDSRGKGFADYLRAKHVPLPAKLLPYCWEEAE